MAPMMFLLAAALLVARAGVAVGDDYGNDYLSAQPIAIGENRAGILETTDDMDFFSFPGEAGTSYHFETLLTNLRDSFLTLYDRDGIVPLAVNDDCGPGVYYQSCITYTFSQSGTYFLEVTSWAASFSGSYSVMVTELTYTSADDYRNAPSLASEILPEQQVPGRLEIPQDVDFFSFTAQAGERFFAQVVLSGLVDSIMTLFDRDGVAILVSNDDCSDGVTYSCLDYTFSVSGAYFLAVTSYNHSSTYTGTGGYSILLKEVCLTCVVAAQGSVFIPNPVVSSRGGTFSDNSDKSSPSLEAELKPVVFKIFEAAEPNAFTLDGPYVTTRPTSGRVSMPSAAFDFTRFDDGFEEVMTYYHIDLMQRYIQGTLGFTNVVNRSVPVNVRGTSYDNSYYDPTDGSITFGTGGVDDAEDAEIIAHEYGHAIQDSQVPFFGLSHEAAAMGEGFSDYWAASFYAAYSGGFQDECVGEWDVSGFSTPRPCLRRVDEQKHYPEVLSESTDEHEVGKIWSATLWEIRMVAGREDMDRMVVQSHFYLDARSNFAEGAQAIIQADQVLYGGLYECAIKDAFYRRGILSPAVNILDIIRILNMSINPGLVPPAGSPQFLCVDKNSDAQVSVLDAIKALRTILGAD